MTIPLKLSNIHQGKVCERVQADIDQEIFKYFFGLRVKDKMTPGVFTGDRGPRIAMITFFFQKLYEECVASGLKPEWDPENEPKVAEILGRLNFKPVPKKEKNVRRTRPAN